MANDIQNPDYFVSHWLVHPAILLALSTPILLGGVNL
jgi:hypothetical protein